MPIKRIQSTTIQVSDQDTAIDFFTNKLGFELRSDQPFGTGDDHNDLRWVEVAPPGADTVLILAKGYGEGASQAGRFSGLVFATDDIQATYEEMAGRGVHFTEAPTMQPWGMMQALFEDQDGTGFVLVGRP